MTETLRATKRIDTRGILRTAVSLILPSDERGFDRLPIADVAEYTGPRADDPALLAEVGRRLDAVYLALKVEQIEKSVTLLI